MRAEGCSFMRGLEQSRPVLAAAPGAALAVPFTMRMQVGNWQTIRGSSQGLPGFRALQLLAAAPLGLSPVAGLCCRGIVSFSLVMILAVDVGT
jgi:hypothetical protein